MIGSNVETATAQRVQWMGHWLKTPDEADSFTFAVTVWPTNVPLPLVVGALSTGPKQYTINKTPASALKDRNAYKVTREIL